MNYQLHYNLLIERSKKENRKIRNRSDVSYIYYEKHHIIPKCLGGDNSKTNIVLLTPEEHYVAHQLLAKIYPENLGLLFAAVRMTFSKNGERINNKLYSWLRKRLSLANSELHKNKKIGMHGKHHSAETKQKMSENNYFKNGGKQLKGKDSPNYGLRRSDECRKKISEKRKGSPTVEHHTEDTKRKMREKRKLQVRTSDKKVSVNGIIFNSVTQAAKSVGITASAFCKRMRSGKYPEYTYLET